MIKITYSAVFTFSFLALNCFADTAFIQSNSVTTVKGQAVAEAKMDVLAYFVPKYTLVPGPKNDKAAAACSFSEDQYKMTGSGIVRTTPVARGADGSYSFKVPTGGKRGSCDYVLDSLYFTITDQEMLVPIQMRTEMNVNYANWLIAAQVGPENVEKLEPAATLNCEFSKAKEDMGSTCFIGDEMLVYDIQIQGTGETFTLDLLDLNKPSDTTM